MPDGVIDEATANNPIVRRMYICRLVRLAMLVPVVHSTFVTMGTLLRTVFYVFPTLPYL